MLHQADIHVEFSPMNLKEIDEAKKKYIEARSQGRTITDLNGVPVDSFRSSLGGFIIQASALQENDFAMRIFDETGDRRIIWNASDPAQIKEAKNLFDKYVAKGWKPYAIDKSGRVGRRIRAFDSDQEEIVFDEDGIRDKLKNFASKFKEIKMMPRTYPG